MDTKKWWASKSIWANVIMMVATVVNGQFDFVNIGMDAQAAILVVVNLVLRAVTKSEIVWN